MTWRNHTFPRPTLCLWAWSSLTFHLCAEGDGGAGRIRSQRDEENKRPLKGDRADLLTVLSHLALLVTLWIILTARFQMRKCGEEEGGEGGRGEGRKEGRGRPELSPFIRKGDNFLNVAKTYSCCQKTMFSPSAPENQVFSFCTFCFQQETRRREVPEPPILIPPSRPPFKMALGPAWGAQRPWWTAFPEVFLTCNDGNPLLASFLTELPTMKWTLTKHLMYVGNFQMCYFIYSSQQPCRD